jgi:hypothetical protein
MGLSDFVNKPHNTPLHSSGYAKIASGGTIGSASPQSFDQRVDIDRGRQAVGRYGHSMIGRGDMKETARTRMDNPLRKTGPVARSRSQMNARSGMATPRPQFKEPPARGYNPYQ